MSRGEEISRDAIVAEALSWVGTPYRHQASLKGAGCDCLGLVRGIWRALHGEEPEAMPGYTPDWAEARGAETLAEAARRHFKAIGLATASPGDVILFRWRENLPAKHAGVLIGDGRFVHAQQGAAVATVAFTPWWRRRAAFAFRFPAVEREANTAEGRPGRERN
jgi:NlpC/P60 family putative phage cell wall peptidase